MLLVLLLELCALTETLILDEDGLYDPTQFRGWPCADAAGPA